ncbi:MAG: excalibur calcium-binding domain-containing protein [Candidatus Moranbacteria bacterium]|nr:excalibur calcium-binding domain-containing protein [Candidatus Moranbacteria bacterium]
MSEVHQDEALEAKTEVKSEVKKKNPTAPSRDIADWRKSKKVRLSILVGLIVLVGVIAFFFTKLRVWMIGIMLLLFVGLGLEVSNTDYDLGKMWETKSLSESKVLRDKEGNIVTDASQGKATDEYNCEDFDTQPQAQMFFDKAGGASNDTNRLDGNKDGEACESLPKGAK